MDQTQVLQLRNVFSASYINLHIMFICIVMVNVCFSNTNKLSLTLVKVIRKYCLSALVT